MKIQHFVTLALEGNFKVIITHSFTMNFLNIINSTCKFQMYFISFISKMFLKTQIWWVQDNLTSLYNRAMKKLPRQLFRQAAGTLFWKLENSVMMEMQMNLMGVLLFAPLNLAFLAKLIFSGLPNAQNVEMANCYTENCVTTGRMMVLDVLWNA